VGGRLSLPGLDCDAPRSRGKGTSMRAPTRIATAFRQRLGNLARLHRENSWLLLNAGDLRRPPQRVIMAPIQDT
jgi:hypothetical protein